MEWKGGRRGGNIDDRRGNRRIEALLSRNPTFQREAGPAFVRPDMRYGNSGVSPIVREIRAERVPGMKKGGVVGNGCAIRGKTKGRNR